MKVLVHILAFINNISTIHKTLHYSGSSCHFEHNAVMFLSSHIVIYRLKNRKSVGRHLLKSANSDNKYIDLVLFQVSISIIVADINTFYYLFILYL